MLCTAFGTFRFCPRVNEPRVGIRACFSRAEITDSGQANPTRLCRGDETRTLFSTGDQLIKPEAGKTRMQTHELKECFKVWKCEGQDSLCFWNRSYIS